MILLSSTPETRGDPEPPPSLPREGTPCGFGTLQWSRDAKVGDDRHTGWGQEAQGARVEEGPRPLSLGPETEVPDLSSGRVGEVVVVAVPDGPAVTGGLGVTETSPYALRSQVGPCGHPPRKDRLLTPSFKGHYPGRGMGGPDRPGSSLWVLTGAGSSRSGTTRNTQG